MTDLRGTGFFAMEGKWDAQTMLCFLCYFRLECSYHQQKKNVLKVLLGGGGGGGGMHRMGPRNA